MTTHYAMNMDFKTPSCLGWYGRSSVSVKIPEIDDTAARQIAAHIQYAHNRFSSTANMVLSWQDWAMSAKVCPKTSRVCLCQRTSASTTSFQQASRGWSFKV